ncbi:uncharacterized protein LOC117176413 [Belonocnema kinseyi]|uniref:uncharacterized protein LOC117176413 n=1 Tax=Belonocnema kinseyi TaxID=2817044 RepID=UPI00143DE2FB|nr:uncharacterized protein LOC117176413 [Belonocnema kinseyi]
MKQNNPIQHQTPEYSQRTSERRNSDASLEHYAKGTLNIPPAVAYNSGHIVFDMSTEKLISKPGEVIPMPAPPKQRRKHKQPEGTSGEKEDLNMNEPVHVPLVRRRRYQEAEDSNTRELVHDPSMRSRVNSQKKEQQRSIQHEQSGYYNQPRNEDFSDTHNSSQNQPPALHAINQSITPGEYQTTRTANRNAARPTVVTNTRDLFSVQPQRLKSPSQDDEPELLYNDTSYLNNPYNDYRPLDPKNNPYH